MPKGVGYGKGKGKEVKKLKKALGGAGNPTAAGTRGQKSVGTALGALKRQAAKRRKALDF